MQRYYDEEAEVSSDEFEHSSDESDGDMSDATREALRQMIDDGDIEDDDAAMYAAFHNQVMLGGRDSCRICGSTAQDRAYLLHNTPGLGCDHAFCFVCIWNWNRVEPGRCPVCSEAYTEIHHEICDRCDAVREHDPAGHAGDPQSAARWPHGIHGVHFGGVPRPLAGGLGRGSLGGYDEDEDLDDGEDDDDDGGDGRRRRLASAAALADLQTGELTCEHCLQDKDAANLLCCPVCDRFWHLGCLGLATVPDLQDWSCPSCSRTQLSLVQLFNKAAARSGNPSAISRGRGGARNLRQQQLLTRRSRPHESLALASRRTGAAAEAAPKRLKSSSGSPLSPRPALLKPLEALSPGRQLPAAPVAGSKRKAPPGTFGTPPSSSASSSSDESDDSSGSPSDGTGGGDHVVFLFDSAAPAPAVSAPRHPQQPVVASPPRPKSRFERRQELANLKAAKQHQLDARRDQLLHRVQRLNRDIRRRRILAMESARHQQQQRRRRHSLKNAAAPGASRAAARRSQSTPHEQQRQVRRRAMDRIRESLQTILKRRLQRSGVGSAEIRRLLGLGPEDCPNPAQSRVPSKAPRQVEPGRQTKQANAFLRSLLS